MLEEGEKEGKKKKERNKNRIQRYVEQHRSVNRLYVARYHGIR